MYLLILKKINTYEILCSADGDYLFLSLLVQRKVSIFCGFTSKSFAFFLHSKGVCEWRPLL